MNIFTRIGRILGPGFITGASDDDPSGIGTFAHTGAHFGLQQLWVAFFALPFMVTVQEMCGRIGIVQGRGLAAVVKKYYTRPVLFGTVALLVIANTLNIGADLGAMSSSLQLLIPLPFSLILIFFTLLSVIIQITVPYRIYARFLKYLTLSLLVYIATTFVVKLDWRTIALSVFLPTISFSKEYLFNIVALLGTTISPYLFFWQADEEVEEEVLQHKLAEMGKGHPRVSMHDLKVMRLDTLFGMLFSNMLMFFIILTTAATLGANGITSIDSAADAAAALRPIVGTFASFIFTIGILGTGLLAVPILAGSAGYAVAESMGWSAGLYKTFTRAPKFYLMIALLTVIGMCINWIGIPPFKMLYYTAMVNGLLAPPLLILIISMGNNRRIVGKYVNSKRTNILACFITLVMMVCGISLLVSFI